MKFCCVNVIKHLDILHLLLQRRHPFIVKNIKKELFTYGGVKRNTNSFFSLNRIKTKIIELAVYNSDLCVFIAGTVPIAQGKPCVSD